MYFADLKEIDFINGEGVRVSLFVSGCTHACPNCFNKPAWNFTYGEEFTVETFKKIKDLVSLDYIKGLSILGGEPFENVEGLIDLVKEIKGLESNPKKDIWVWSGYTFEQIIKDEQKLELLKYCDVLVDGRFVETKKDLKLKFRGSSNQRVLDVKKSIESKLPVNYIFST